MVKKLAAITGFCCSISASAILKGEPIIKAQRSGISLFEAKFKKEKQRTTVEESFAESKTTIPIPTSLEKELELNINSFRKEKEKALKKIKGKASEFLHWKVKKEEALFKNSHTEEENPPLFEEKNHQQKQEQEKNKNRN